MVTTKSLLKWLDSRTLETIFYFDNTKKELEYGTERVVYREIDTKPRLYSACILSSALKVDIEVLLLNLTPR